MTTDAGRLSRNAVVMIVLAVIQRGLGLITIFILARLLDARGLGAYAFAQSTSQTFFGVARLGADAGLHVSVSKLRLPDDKPLAEALLGEALVLFLSLAAIAASVLILLAEPIAATMFGAPELAPFVSASAVMLAAQVINQYCYCVFAGLSAFGVYARLTWLTSLLTLSLAVLGAFMYGTIGAVWAAAAGMALTALALVVWLFRDLASRGIPPRPRLPAKAAFAILALGLPFYLSGLLLIPAEFICLGYLSRLEGVGALGELRVVQSLMSAATVLPAALAGPLVSHLASRIDRPGGFDAVLVQLRAICLLSLAITIGFATLWPILLDTIFGARFPVAKSDGVLALLAFTPMMLLSVLTGAFLASRRSFALIAIGFLQMLVIACSAPPLIAHLGLAGYFAVQALHLSIGVVAAATLLARQYTERILRYWMLPLGAMTFAVSLLLVGDVLAHVAVSTRLAVGAAMMTVHLATCFAFVFTAAERASMVAVSAATLCRLRAGRHPAPAAGREPQ